MRVLQHIAMFTLDKLDAKNFAAIQAQAEKMGKVIPGIISITFSENKTDFYKDYDDRRRGNNYTLLVIFQEDKSMKVYMDHKEHTQVIISTQYNVNCEYAEQTYKHI